MRTECMVGAAITMSAGATFLTLPVEIRQKVYQHLFAGAHLISCPSIYPLHQQQYLTRTNRVRSNVLGILLANRTIYNEAHDSLYEAAIIDFRGFDASRYIGPPRFGRRTAAASPSPVAVRLIRSIVLDDQKSMSGLQQVIDCMPALQEITIHCTKQSSEWGYDSHPFLTCNVLQPAQSSSPQKLETWMEAKTSRKDLSMIVCEEDLFCDALDNVHVPDMIRVLRQGVPRVTIRVDTGWHGPSGPLGADRWYALVSLGRHASICETTDTE